MKQRRRVGFPPGAINIVSGEEVAIGEVQRAVIDRERFMRRFGCEPDGTPKTPDAPAS